jgi:serine/threonine-protein kinase
MQITDASTEFGLGTPAYISPEQIAGEELDNRSDLYSVGVILYELLTGHLPFSGRSTMDLMLAHATEPPPPFADKGAGDWAPPAIEAVVQACLAKNRAQRPASAMELCERFEAALGEEMAAEQKASEEVQKSKMPSPPVHVFDPSAMIFELEAWMPEQIATYKLCGFVNDLGGQVLSSERGLIRVQFGKPTNSWFGLGRRPVIHMELHLRRADAERESLLNITVVMRSADKEEILDADFRGRCEQIYCELRGYLIGKTGISKELLGAQR